MCNNKRLHVKYYNFVFILFNYYYLYLFNMITMEVVMIII